MSLDLRKIDALVAEKVMGWPPHDLERIWSNTGESCVPKYSSDIAAAWTVVEKLTGRYQVHVGQELKGFSAAFTEYAVLMIPKYVQAATAPLAICLATLKVLNIQIPD